MSTPPVLPILDLDPAPLRALTGEPVRELVTGAVRDVSPVRLRSWVPGASITPGMTGTIDEGGRARVLLVDDEESIRDALGRVLRARGYEVRTAGCGEEAIAILADERFEILLCDVRLPGMQGTEVVPLALEQDPDLAVLMLSAVNDAGTATGALTHGALDYLMKPIELSDLERALGRALELRDEAAARRRTERRILEEVAVRTAELHERTGELEAEREALRTLTVRVAATLINAMEAKDLYLRGHSQRVADLAATMAEELGLDADTVENVRLAGRLHDVGKIGIREEILNKPGALTPEEFEHVKDHVRVGMEILEPLQHLGPVLTFVRDHHEHWDGGGYPQGLAGEAISIGGRILCAADAYDALTSRRAYRDPLSQEETLALLEAQAERLLDPQVLEVLVTVLERQSALVFLE